MFTYAIASKFVPTRGQSYFSIDSKLTATKNFSNLVRKHRWTGDRYDRARLAVGNVFATAAKAQTTRDAILGVVKAAQLV
jgi:hypothetical protein